MVRVGADTDADLLVTWSPWNGSRRAALQSSYKAVGKTVVVMENGWLSPMTQLPFYQVARDGWNGTGLFPPGDAERWRQWNVTKKPWRRDDTGVVLIIGQRGHPTDRRTSPPGWEATVLPDHPRALRRPRECRHPLADHLAMASQVHVWSSNAASHAIVAGVPVVQHGPNLMVTNLASRPGEPLRRPERAGELQRLSGAQWSAVELESGEPFSRLLAQ